MTALNILKLKKSVELKKSKTFKSYTFFDQVNHWANNTLISKTLSNKRKTKTPLKIGKTRKKISIIKISNYLKIKVKTTELLKS